MNIVKDNGELKEMRSMDIWAQKLHSGFNFMTKEGKGIFYGLVVPHRCPKRKSGRKLNEREGESVSTCCKSLYLI